MYFWVVVVDREKECSAYLPCYVTVFVIPLDVHQKVSVLSMSQTTQIM